MAAIAGLVRAQRVIPRGASRVVEAPRERRDLLQVGARAEAHVAGAGEDEHARRVVGLEGVEAFAQALGGHPVDGVAPVWAVDGQDGGRADPLVANLVGHRPTLQRRTSRAGRCPRRSIHQRGGIS
jgi:hypothetical protein